MNESFNHSVLREAYGLGLIGEGWYEFKEGVHGHRKALTMEARRLLEFAKVVKRLVKSMNPLAPTNNGAGFRASRPATIFYKNRNLLQTANGLN
ncbi:hypothetical protein ACFL1V_04295 [Pseudomonadota bacterium]